ncbi:MAG: hypothetical protein AAB795_00795 [Patescibacteria group bacterium]
MVAKKLNKVLISKAQFDKRWKDLPLKQRSTLEKRWDTDHAYYSSTLEGNGLDKKRFEELAKKIK